MTMKTIRLFFYVLLLSFLTSTTFGQNTSTNDIYQKLSEFPLKCIEQEYPNKTGHIIADSVDAKATPRELHPSFYGCFDWHSSVHGHWSLVRLLKNKPDLQNVDLIIEILDRSFNEQNIIEEANYFDKYKLNSVFERTYGWAWLLKLDQELASFDNPKAKIWYHNLQPLTRKVVNMWKAYLPKQTYPNRTGVHGNSAFALAFAIDWARAMNDEEFKYALVEKAKSFYLNNVNTPAYSEPDGSDFFSPSLQIADLMSRILSQDEFSEWITRFYEKPSIENICKAPVISDLTDYQIVHLVGLSFSKSWCMKHISNRLPDDNPLKQLFGETSKTLLKEALPSVFQGNYGGDHWLASFALLAID